MLAVQPGRQGRARVPTDRPWNAAGGQSAPHAAPQVAAAPCETGADRSGGAAAEHLAPSARTVPSDWGLHEGLDTGGGSSVSCTCIARVAARAWNPKDEQRSLVYHMDHDRSRRL